MAAKQRKTKSDFEAPLGPTVSWLELTRNRRTIDEIAARAKTAVRIGENGKRSTIRRK